MSDMNDRVTVIRLKTPGSGFSHQNKIKTEV